MKHFIRISFGLPLLAVLLQGCTTSVLVKNAGATVAPVGKNGDIKQANKQGTDAEVVDTCRHYKLSDDEHYLLEASKTFGSDQQREAYQASIFQRAYMRQIYNCWRVPPNTYGSKVSVRVTLTDDGQINSVVFFQSEGNDALEKSINEAMLRAAPFELPEDEALRKMARRMIISFESR